MIVVIFVKIFYQSMKVKKTYIQQLCFDGKTYKKGVVVDLLAKFNIAAREFPFKINPEAKELPARDWAGEDGRDVYIPKTIPMKNYDMEAEFLYCGTEATISDDVSAFINFIYGRNKDAVGGRLAMYDEHTNTGRKDVHVLSVDNNLYEVDDSDPDAIASFKVKLSVEDPTTDVALKKSIISGKEVVTDLEFK